MGKIDKNMNSQDKSGNFKNMLLLFSTLFFYIIILLLHYLPNLLKEWRRLRLNFWTVDNLPADLEVGPEVNFVVVLLEDAASVFGSENGENKANKEDESDTILLKGTQNGIGSIV